MSEDNDSKEDEQKAKRSINRGVKFPYHSLKECVELTEKIQKESGGKGSKKTIANILDTKITSSVFETKISSMKQFNLIEKKGEFLSLTKLAKNINFPVDDSREKNLLEAFSACSLYKELLNRLSGAKIISKNTLKNILVSEFNISSSKRTYDIAVDAFIESCVFIGVIKKEDDSLIVTDQFENLKISVESEDFESEDIETDDTFKITKDFSSKNAKVTVKSKQSVGMQKLELNLLINVHFSPEISVDELKEKLDLIKDFIQNLQIKS